MNGAANLLPLLSYNK
ncbi:hypothetical protein CP061683_0642A, partial [Chlamydia psittaci 06-1683]